MSAYDLLPQEDREAIAWVREHGGLEEVEAHWSGRVPLTSVKRMVALHKAKRERLKAHAMGLERKCAERGETIRELSGKAAKQSDEIRVMRDVIVETCARLGVEGTGSTVDDAQVIWREISRRLMPEGCQWPTVDGRKVDFKTQYQPSLGVLEALSIYSNGACEVMSHDGIIKPVSEIHVVVPAADGKPLEAGQTVYATHYAYVKCTVLAIEWYVDGYLVEVENEGGCKFRQTPDEFVHQRPDSWERIEEDAKKEACAYFGVEGGGYGCSECPVKQWEESCDEVKSSDLVRRCRALAERERGE